MQGQLFLAHVRPNGQIYFVADMTADEKA